MYWNMQAPDMKSPVKISSSALDTTASATLGVKVYVSICIFLSQMSFQGR